MTTLTDTSTKRSDHQPLAVEINEIIRKRIAEGHASVGEALAASMAIFKAYIGEVRDLDVRARMVQRFAEAAMPASREGDAPS
jgi:hypothetical protein